MPLIALRSQQGVALQVQGLVIAVGRNAHVADGRVYGNPELIGFRTLTHSDRVSRTGFDAQTRHQTP